MKKTIHFLFLLGLILTFKNTSAQVPGLVVSPQNQCFSAGGSTAVAYISPSNPAATSYSWVAIAPNCTASVNTFSNGAFAYINYPCCGVYTITAFAFSGSALVGTYQQVSNVSCGNFITISASNSTICAGSSAILTASGASSYTWSNGAVSQSISVTPSVSTCYTVAGSNVSGCIGTAVSCVYVYTPSIFVTGPSSVCPGSSSTLTAGGAYSFTWYTSSGTFTGSTIVLTPSATTCYSLIGTNSIGCTANASGCVSVGSGTPSPVISGNFNTCGGQSTILSASGASSYTWFPMGTVSSSIVVSPSVTTCYTLVGYSCGNSASAVRCVTVGSAPVLSVSGNTVVCSGNSTTLTVSGASSYSWVTNQGISTGTSIVLTVSATTCYSIIGTNGSGCPGYYSGCLFPSGTPSPVISGNFNTCGGQSTILSASGASSYTWFPMGTVSSSIVVSPSVTTCYTLVGYSCGNSASAVRCVTVGSAPVLSVSGNTVVCSGNSTTLTVSGASSYSWVTNQGISTGTSIVLTVSATTCYSIIGTNGSGCPGYYSGCLFPSGTPSPVISGNFNTCGGQSTILSASGASSYTWFPMGTVSSSIVVSPSVTTCYTLVGYSCGNLASAVRCVTVGSAPVLSVSGNTVVCSGNSTTLTVSGASSYSWVTNQGISTGTSIVLTVSATTCYSIIGTNGSGCPGYYSGCLFPSGTPSPVISGNFNTCGQSTILSASGASSYTWFPMGTVSSSIIVSPSVTTCYTLVGYSCGNSASAVRCVTVGALPVISVSGNTNICAGSGATLTASGALGYTWFTSMGTFTGSTIVLSPSATACYTAMGYTGPNCVGYASGCVSVSSGTPNPVISGNFNTCGGQSTILSASGASSYTWFPMGTVSSSIVVSPSVTTCYTLVGYSCGNLASAVRCVTVGSAPVLSVSGNTVVCSGNSTTLTVSGASSYSWVTNQGISTGTSIVLTVSATTCYSIIGTNGSGCPGYYSGCLFPSPNTPSPVISGNFNTCGGQSTILSASGASSYTWFPMGTVSSSIVVSPSVTTCYTLVGYSCGNLASAVRCVTVGSAPVLSVSGNTAICSGNGATLTAGGASSYTWYTSQGTFTSSTIVLTPSATSCYSLIGSNAPGCTGYSGGCVSVQSSPTLTLGGNLSLCSGSSTFLSVSGAATYTWLPGNIVGSSITITPSVSTCYTVVGTSANGCVGLGYRCLQVVPNPTITTTNPGIICAGTSATLTAQGASTYTWVPFNLTGSNIVITPSVGMCYTVTGANSSGCTNSAIGCFSVLPTPVITVSGNDSLCAGMSSTLVASGASSYTWFPSNVTGPYIVVTPTASTCYTVYSNSYGCISTAVKCISVNYSANLNISGANIICSGSSANLLASGANTYTWSNGSNSPFITVNPSVSSCYTVSGTTAGGCIGSAVKCLSVQSTPVITITGPAPVCAGTGILLNASGASSYIWSTGSTNNFITAAPNSTTVYSVTGSNGPCSAVKAYTVVVYPKPSIYIYRTDSVFNDSTICAGNAVHLTTYGTAVTFTWSTGSTSQNITVSPSVTTTYTVSGTNSSGCTNSNFITLYVSACTGVAKNFNDVQLGIYPNPTSGQVTLQGDGSTRINYTVYDVIGKEVLKGEFTDTKNVDLSRFANGPYTIRFESGSFSTYKKLILEK